MSAPAEPPTYKGEPLDAERGPGLGCFWIQIGLLTFFLILTPLTVTWGWDPFISGALLIFTLILLLISGQTIIFLLRLVAADRRTRRAPLDPAAKPTVGQLEERAGEAEDRAGVAADPAGEAGAAVPPDHPAEAAERASEVADSAGEPVSPPSDRPADQPSIRPAEPPPDGDRHA